MVNDEASEIFCLGGYKNFCVFVVDNEWVVNSIQFLYALQNAIA